MSYHWREKSNLMTCTSLLLRALEECGVLETTQSSIVTRISEARAAVDATQGKAKISALKQLRALQEDLNAEATIPQTIELRGYDFNLRYSLGRFVAGQDELEYESDADRQAERADELFSRIEEKYSELENEILGDYDKIMEDLEREIYAEDMRLLTATVRAEREEAIREEMVLRQTEREAYLDSIERRKRIADEEIMKNAKKIGYKVKKKKIGKTVQYVLVNR